MQQELIQQLVTLDKIVYLTVHPYPLDNTAGRKYQPMLFVGDQKRFLKIPLYGEDFNFLCCALDLTIFTEGHVVISWGMKSLLSYLRSKKYEFVPECKVFDIEVIESFLGFDKNPPPKDFNEAVQRMKILGDRSSEWDHVYREIHLPLIKEIVPQLENVGINDLRQKHAKFAYYEIDGQANGRFRCSSKLFRRGYNAHTIGPEQRQHYRPVDDSKLFLYLDFNHMEVSVLQWLSQDENMGKILKSPYDFYEAISILLTGGKDRNLGKNFLPIIYGMGAWSLSKKLQISEDLAGDYIHTLRNKFPTAVEYVESYLHKSKQDNKACDYFGRCRRFDPNDDRMDNQIRNFLIQAPANIVCLEKLIDLNREVPVAFHVHDGYCLYVKKNYQKVLAKAKAVLESPSRMLEGLELKISSTVGPSLNEMEGC